MPFLEKTTICGDYIHKQRYFALHTGKRMPRWGEAGESGEKQQQRNEKNARFRLRCLIQANFPKGTYFTLTHAERKPIDENTAKKRVGQYIKDLRGAMRSRGTELKYIMVHECQDGRWHTHIITNEPSLDAVASLWTHGIIKPSYINRYDHHVGLVNYLLGEEKSKRNSDSGENVKTPRRKHARRWIPSRNLEQPEVTVKEIKREGVMWRHPKAPKGYQLQFDLSIGCDMAGNPWQHYTCVRIPENKKKGTTNHEQKARNSHKREPLSQAADPGGHKRKGNPGRAG